LVKLFACARLFFSRSLINLRTIKSIGKVIELAYSNCTRPLLKKFLRHLLDIIDLLRAIKSMLWEGIVRIDPFGLRSDPSQSGNGGNQDPNDNNSNNHLGDEDGADRDDDEEDEEDGDDNDNDDDDGYEGDLESNGDPTRELADMSLDEQKVPSIDHNPDGMGTRRRKSEREVPSSKSRGIEDDLGVDNDLVGGDVVGDVMDVDMDGSLSSPNSSDEDLLSAKVKIDSDGNIVPASDSDESLTSSDSDQVVPRSSTPKPGFDNK